MRRAAWVLVHLLAAYLSIAASTTTLDSPISDLPAAPIDPSSDSNVQRTWFSPSTNTRAEHVQDEEKSHPGRPSFPRRTTSRRRRRIHP
jgi:hypothetical protein